LKLIAMPLIIAASLLAGRSFAGTYLRRFRELGALRKCMLMLKGQITYAGCLLEECFDDIAVRCSERAVAGLFQAAADRLSCSDCKSAGCIWAECVAMSEKNLALNKDDIRELTQLSDCLGYLDVNHQINVIELYIAVLDDAIARAGEQLDGKCRTAKALCMAAGAFLCILLI